MKRQSELLMRMKKDEMIETAFRLGLPPFRKTAKKAEWAAYIEQNMDQYGENLLLMLRLEEAEMLQKHLDKGLRISLEGVDEDFAVLLDAMQPLLACGLAEPVEDGFEVDARLPGWLPSTEADRAQMHMQDLLYDYMQGWLLHVGVMPVQELTARAAALVEPDIHAQRDDVQQLCIALLLSRADGDTLIDVDGELWVMHDELEDPHALLDRLHSPPADRLAYPDFDEDALVFAATQSLVPGDLKLYRPLLDELDKRGVEDSDALVGDAVMLMQNNRFNDAVDMLMEEVSPKNLEDANKVLQLFSDLCNSLPHWANKGHSPKELMRSVPPRRNAPVLGRNERCPCGSGKKYKHCCGRRLQ